MVAWEFSNLQLRYTHKKTCVDALKNVSFKINDGESIAITGTSGSGKSSLLSIMMGMQKPTGGACFFWGRDISQFSAEESAQFRAEDIGFVFQNFCLMPHLNLLDNVLLGVDHLPRKHFESTAIDLLNKVGLQDQFLRYPHQVSGGQAQRTAIARALLRKPKFILADEPTGALDNETSSQIIDLLLHFKEDGCGLILVTHNEQVANAMGRKISLSYGEVVFDSHIQN
jgi:putative ABC transport system ATP-binding protein|nr:ATP-binding cassette domain-containing protein [uncultured Undibacterium sp.]